MLMIRKATESKAIKVHIILANNLMCEWKHSNPFNTYSLKI